MCTSCSGIKLLNKKFQTRLTFNTGLDIAPVGVTFCLFFPFLSYNNNTRQRKDNNNYCFGLKEGQTQDQLLLKQRHFWENFELKKMARRSFGNPP